MTIQPSAPPGRANRKLRAHLADIERLRAQGYSIEAIREAFCSAGIEIGWATVQREVARLSNKTKPSSAPTTITREESSEPAPTLPAQKVMPTDKRSAVAAPENISADDYFQQHNANPLFNRNKKGSP